MALYMPVLETERLSVRPFVGDDLNAIHQILDIDLGYSVGDEPSQALDERRAWLEWSIANDVQLAKLYQPPFGDRAIVHKESGELIGAVGYNPCLMPFGQLASLTADPAGNQLYTMEIGLFWALSSAHRGRGYATEAARALIEYAFTQLRARRVVATTEFTNAASIGVMQRLGMRIKRNLYPEPPWFQVVGLLENM